MSPVVSVIIPAYRYSAALCCAIQSVLAQTYTQFELLVVGDGCDGDCEKVAASFTDVRVSWFNLPKHSGGAAAPRNEGLKRARGEYIAYLDQDDVWHMAHLQSCINAVKDQQAEVAVATLIAYGLEGSGIRQISGIFPRGRYTADLYIPASSLFHHRSVVEKITVWAKPLDARLPIDGDYISRMHLAKCKIVPTKQLTVFCYPSSWRQNSYTENRASEQAAMLARLQNTKDVQHRELIDALTSVGSGEGAIMRMPNPHIPPALREEKANAVRGLLAAPALQECDGPMQFYMDALERPMEWHPTENNAVNGPFRWSGPSRSPSIILPVRPSMPCTLEVRVLWFINKDDAEELKILMDGKETTYKTCRDQRGIYTFTVDYTPLEERKGPLTITFQLPQCYQPHDFNVNADLRYLGLAVNRIEITPHTQTQEKAA